MSYREDNSMHKSLQKVIETLKAHMSAGDLIWHNPCLIRAQSNAFSGKAYQGINQFITAIVANTEDYKSPYWATFRQIQQAGGQLTEAKGKGVPIIFYKRLDASDSEDTEQARFVIRHSFVFNLDLVRDVQMVSIPQSATGKSVRVSGAEHIATRYLAREQISVSHGAPAYAPALDRVYMPSVEEVVSTDEFYSTYFHELAHSTGHPHRLCRFAADAGRFESKDEYSREELVAEITAAMLCHDCEVDSQASIQNSAAYLQGWSRFIHAEAEAFLGAVNQAYKARAFILAGEGV
ncbi:MAG: hypothetical protein CME59_16270 [Halioglobus sp.]|nr:hypothetical protein [Halioglobus sp.]|tara:strand:- start:599 stop:1477 length:879 start_codon:yes stop_codon:yes gene_type:complete